MKEDAWRKCHKLVEKYDNEMCGAWKEEVDKLMIFVRPNGILWSCTG